MDYIKEILASFNALYSADLEEKASKLTQGGWGTYGEGTWKYHNG